MKKLKIIIISIAACILLYACPCKEAGHNFINFVNSSDRDVSCQTLWWGNISESDTLFQCRAGVDKIVAGSSHIFNSLNNSGWEDDFTVIPYLQFLIMDDSTFKYYSEKLNHQLIENCDTIRKYVPILYCYRLTLEDLQRMNWTVVYPPE